jgi:tetratricopeptide (TPR) repeat protein
MSKPLSACLLVLCAAAALPAAPTLPEARQRLLKGNYEEAQSAYEELLKDAKSRGPAAVGLSRALERQGEYDKALAAVTTALKALPENADLLARKAELLYTRGRWEDAEKAADAAVKVQDKNFTARWVRAQVCRDRGDLKKAEDEYRWFIRAYDPDKPAPAEALLRIGLATCEYARIHALSDEMDTVLNDLWKDALKADPDFWPVEYQAGMLLLERFNRGEALDAFDNVLKINPNCAEALTAKGVAALARFEIKEAERFAEQALKSNPRLPEALRLRADVHLASGDAAAALRELTRARTVNPHDERTAARVAACFHLQRKKEPLDALVKEVEKHDSKPAVFWFELGERLEERRYYNEAEKYYKLATKLRPRMAAPINGLGLLYMRLAREDEAAPLLKQGFAIDRSNVRVSNTLKVLRHLEKYDTIKTAHFHLRYNPEADTAQAKFMADYLEAIYADLAKKFDYRPKGPILIEVFSSHQMFSGRVIALPDLHTIGACTGRMIAMASPHARGLNKRFNWVRVLRHELVHIFNLEQTNFLVPHWLTEGLAVSNEGFPRPQAWNEMLVQRLDQDKLFNLDTIDLGFIRPRNPLEWQLAYCQSQLYVEYIRKEYGDKAIGRLLAAYADGLNTAAALARACGKVDKAAFEKGYLAYLKEVVKPLRGKKPAGPARTLKQLQADYQKDPNNADLAAELALRLLPRNRKQARKLAEEARQRKTDHPKACFVLARLAHAAGDEDREKRLLEDGLDKKDPDPLILKALGKLYYDAGEFAKAAEVYELGRQAQKHDRTWLQELARVYAQTNKRAKQIEVLTDLVPGDADDLDRRVRLAQLLLETDKAAEAERYARQALEIDVRSTEAQDVLYKALEKQDKGEEANRLRGILESKKAKTDPGRGR